MNARAEMPAYRGQLGPAGHHHVVAVSLVIVAEIMLFCGLVAGYLVLRGQAIEWPPPGQPRLPVGVTALSTLLLLLSGWRAFRLSSAVHRSDGAGLRRALLQVMTLGGAFLVIQGAEWVSLLGYGLTTASSVYGATFYTIVGCHAVHVAAGLAALGVVTRRVPHSSDSLGSASVPDALVSPLFGARLFWLFVVAIWPPLYALVYLW